MGKCIVCNKSAGPFYSLHKACYQVYEDTRECLRQEFSKSIISSQQADQFVESIKDCRPSASFSLRLFESLVNRVWQDQAKQVIKSKLVNAEHARYLLNTAPMLEIEDKDVEVHLFTRLENIEHLAQIDQMQSISKSFTGMLNEVDLVSDESLLWIFEGVLKLEKQKRIEDKEWSVFQSLVNSLLKKSRYKEFGETVEATGKLAISDQNIYYVTKKETVTISFLNIHSITPMKDGVRIQVTQSDATPDTYVTGDGRFTYALLRYAQEQRQIEE